MLFAQVYGSSKWVDYCLTRNPSLGHLLHLAVVMNFPLQSKNEPMPKVNIIFPKFTHHYLPTSIYYRSSSLASSESDSEYLPQKVVLKQVSSTIRRRESNNSPNLDFLHKYQDPNRLSPLRPHQPPLCPIRVNTRKKKKVLAQKRRKTQPSVHSQYLGALVLRQFGLVLLAQADNKNLCTDVVDLGISTHPGDKTPPVWHHGIDIDTAMALSTKLGDRRLNKVPAAYWHPPVDISCKTP